MKTRLQKQRKTPSSSALEPESTRFKPRTFIVQPKSADTTPEEKDKPDLQTQLETAERFGHNFGNIPIFAPGTTPPPPIQAKLTIGTPGDKYEKEADRMAAQVVRQLSVPQTQETDQNQSVQRQELEEEELRMKPEADSIQRLTHNGTVIDISTLNLVDSRAYRSRMMRIRNGATQGTDNQYIYAPADEQQLQNQISTLEAAERETRRVQLVTDLSAQLDALATAANFTTQPHWMVNNPAGAEGKETINNQALQPNAVVARWQTFLGPGLYSHKHPRTGAVDNTRLVSGDGQRSIRYGNHEQNSKASLHHFHEESWTYDSGSNTVTVANVVRRVPVK